MMQTSVVELMAGREGEKEVRRHLLQGGMK
jgi:hypothetical protein